MNMGFDPEVPAGYQDADIEMQELADAANEETAAKDWQTRSAKLDERLGEIVNRSNRGKLSEEDLAVIDLAADLIHGLDNSTVAAGWESIKQYWKNI